MVTVLLEDDACSIVVSTGWLMQLNAATCHEHDVVCLKV